jgi:HEPN domain-containing protein
MPPDSLLTGSPEDWLRRARSNLARAREEKPDGVLYEDLCFDAQQAAEKAIKGLLVARRIPFRFVHDIGELLEAATGGGVTVPEGLRDSVELTEYAVEARYPGPFEAVTEEEWRRAVSFAEAVVAWVEAAITDSP